MVCGLLFAPQRFEGTPMLISVVLKGIRLYQRYVSPRKGFACAYRIHTGGQSCSSFGFRAIERHGLTRGLKLLRRRLDLCAWHHYRERNAALARPPAVVRQAGFVYLGSDDGCAPGCSLGECALAENCACDVCEIGACWVALSTCSGGACGGGRQREAWRRDAPAQRRSRYGAGRHW
jgi:putative component of membrane protein insertase Oxa1/YidC/SpoIIIJ protein YidD